MIQIALSRAEANDLERILTKTNKRNRRATVSTAFIDDIRNVVMRLRKEIKASPDSVQVNMLITNDEMTSLLKVVDRSIQINKTTLKRDTKGKAGETEQSLETAATLGAVISRRQALRSKLSEALALSKTELGHEASPNHRIAQNLSPRAGQKTDYKRVYINPNI